MRGGGEGKGKKKNKMKNPIRSRELPFHFVTSPVKNAEQNVNVVEDGPTASR